MPQLRRFAGCPTFAESRFFANRLRWVIYGFCIKISLVFITSIVDSFFDYSLFPIPSNASPRRHPRGPRPLEVEPSQLPGYIHHLANEKQPRHCPRLHRPRLQIRRIHASGRHLSLLKPLRPRGMKLPPVQPPLTFLQRRIRPALRRADLGQVIRQPPRQRLAQCLPKRIQTPPRPRLPQRAQKPRLNSSVPHPFALCAKGWDTTNPRRRVPHPRRIFVFEARVGSLDSRNKIEDQRCPWPPIQRRLQHRRPAQPAMRHQHLFVEGYGL